MAQFVFLYRGGRPLSDLSPSEKQERMNRWLVWFNGLSESGHMKDRGIPLDRPGRVVRGTKANVTDGPYAEKDLVLGITLIEAKDIEEASALVRNHPILQDGGCVEVRPVLELNP